MTPLTVSPTTSPAAVTAWRAATLTSVVARRRDGGLEIVDAAGADLVVHDAHRDDPTQAFSLARLARKAQWLGVDTLAVGTYEELPEVASRYDGDLLVLTPWRPFHPTPDPAFARRDVT